MTFYRGGARRRRDALEPAIIEALRARGVQTWQVGGRAVAARRGGHRTNELSGKQADGTDE